MAKEQESCNFCGKNKEQVAKLIVGSESAICNECVELCRELLVDTPAIQNQPSSGSAQDRDDPQALKNFLDQYVIGQDRAKITLAVAVINHYKRLHRDAAAPEVDKANVLMLGPTGSGKTLLARSVSRFLDIPFVIADATSVTEAGYVGDDVEMMISRLYMASGEDIEKTQKGIVFIDEIDKIARKSESSSITRDVSGEGVQQALLKLVEGTVCRFPARGNRKHPQQDVIEIDTSDILFIAGGAFVGLEAIIHNRLYSSNIGFNGRISTAAQAHLRDLNADDLVKFGLIPELIGRFPVTVSLEQLTKDDLRAIMTSIKNNWISQYQWLLSQDHIDLNFKDSAIDALVDRAMTYNTGARALQSELERALLPHMFHAKTYQRQVIKQIILDDALVNNPNQINQGNQ